MMGDGRKKLRAHWPPRSIQTVEVQLDAEAYGILYLAAAMKNHSLQDEMRERLTRKEARS